MTREEWRPISDFDGLYEVSSLGNVRSVSRLLPFMSKKGNWFVRRTQTKLLAKNSMNAGYHIVHLYRDDARTVRTVHSVVAAAFIGPRPAGLDVDHRNGKRQDNRAENLRYLTRSENCLAGKRRGA